MSASFFGDFLNPAAMSISWTIHLKFRADFCATMKVQIKGDSIERRAFKSSESYVFGIPKNTLSILL